MIHDSDLTDVDAWCKAFCDEDVSVRTFPNHGPYRVIPPVPNTELVEVPRAIFDDVNDVLSPDARWTNEMHFRAGRQNVWDWNRLRFITPRGA